MAGVSSGDLNHLLIVLKKGSAIDLGLVFDEKTFLDQNLFKYENRLRASTSRFVAEGAVLTSYYSLAENRTTVDKGLQNIDQLFGHNSPLRFNKIKNFPIYGFGAQNPSNEDTLQIEDVGSIVNNLLLSDDNNFTISATTRLSILVDWVSVVAPCRAWHVSC